jgi:hypothetical protein
VPLILGRFNHVLPDVNVADASTGGHRSQDLRRRVPFVEGDQAPTLRTSGRESPVNVLRYDISASPTIVTVVPPRQRPDGEVHGRPASGSL